MGPSQRDERKNDLKWAVGIAIMVAVTVISSYFAASLGMETRVSKVETLEQTHFEEVQRSLRSMDLATQRGFERIERFMERIEATGQDRRTGEPYAVQGNQR